MSKRFLAVLAVLALIFVAVLIVGGKNNSDTTANAKPTQHVEGSTSSGVKLVEYGDYECPICGAYYQTVKDVAAKYNSQIQFQFRNFPLTSIHQNALAGARAAEAASLQGKFWQMHDLLYANQSSWSEVTSPQAFFNQYAQSLGLNLTRFKTDYDSSKVNDAVQADLAQANKLGLDATPTFYLDGKKIEVTQLIDANNRPSVDRFSTLIDAAIAAKKK